MSDPRPIIKWPGGKYRVAMPISEQFGEDCTGVYREPFMGAGGVFFARVLSGDIDKAVLSDKNPRLMATWRLIRDKPGRVAAELAKLPTDGDWKESYNKVRAAFNRSSPEGNARHAAMFLWLNKACFNGLYRENKKGEFNTPVGSYETVNVPSEGRLHEVSEILRRHTTALLTLDFAEALSWARAGDQVFVDPPYLPTKNLSDFTAYTGGGFGLSQHIRLVHAMQEAQGRGATLVMTNSWSPLTHAVLDGFEIGYEALPTSRSISRDGATRGKTRDTLVVLRP